MTLLDLINTYGELKWEEGNATGEHSTNLSIKNFNEAERIFNMILIKLEVVLDEVGL